MTIHQDAENGHAKRQGPPPSSGAKLLDEIAPPAALKADRAAIEESKAALKGMQAGYQEWLGWSQGAYKVNVKAFRALSQCRSLHHAMLVQSTLIQDHINLLLDSGGRMTTVTLKTAMESADHARPA
jgi:hypothetical protein